MKKEKTPNRIPFSVFLASRVGMRDLPIKRIGDCAQLRMGERIRAYQQESSLGSQVRCVSPVSKISYLDTE